MRPVTLYDFSCSFFFKLLLFKLESCSENEFRKLYYHLEDARFLSMASLATVLI